VLLLRREFLQAFLRVVGAGGEGASGGGFGRVQILWSAT